MSRFEVYRNAAGEWAWRLKAANGEIVAQSEGYRTRNGAIRGVEAMKRATMLAKVKVLDPAKGPP